MHTAYKLNIHRIRRVHTAYTPETCWVHTAYALAAQWIHTWYTAACWKHTGCTEPTLDTTWIRLDTHLMHWIHMGYILATHWHHTAYTGYTLD